MDKCPKCELEMEVRESGYDMKNDDTPDEPTEIYLVQNQYCRNPNCSNYGKVVDTIKHRLV